MKCYYHSKALLFATVSVVILRPIVAVNFITESRAPDGLSSKCLAALTADVPCGSLVPRFRYGFFYDEATLEKSCTSECEAGLASWETSIVSSCSDDTWDGYDDEGDAPLGYIPSLLRFQYSMTCLRDKDRWCNVVSGALAYMDDPGGVYTTLLIFLIAHSQLIAARKPSSIYRHGGKPDRR